MSAPLDPQMLTLGEYENDVHARYKTLADFPALFWAKDGKAWGKHAEETAKWVGWIDAVAKMEPRATEIETFAKEVRAAGFERVILAGMGGSSLAPLVLSTVFGKAANGLPLSVLDSTDPDTVLRIEREGPLDKALVVVSSKSGSTAEPSAFDAYFFDKIGKPENFVAITDPHSPFEAYARERHFRKIFLNFADIGGRYSALSYFGLVPAALMGISVRELLARARAMQDGNANGGDAFLLGAALGELALQGRNKVTFLAVDQLATLGLWLEQLIAESTGKEGKGILPIAGEEAGPPSVYGNDRVFVALRMNSPDCNFLDVRVSALRDAGHPIVTVDLHDENDLAQEFLRWEIATAVVGAVLEIDPFNQPNVQESKDITKRLLKELEEKGSLPEVKPGVVEGNLSVFGEAANKSVADSLETFMSASEPGSYVSIMAYLPESKELNVQLHRMQADIRDATELATTMGYGPRFLHSTGQFHKGGPNTGFFIQLTADPKEDASIPGQRATWAQFIAAQAAGDLEALAAKGRHTLRIHLGKDPVEGVKTLLLDIQKGLAVQ